MDKLCYSAKNLCDMLKIRGLFVSNHYISNTLKSKYGLTPKNSSYKWYRSEIYADGKSSCNCLFTIEKVGILNLLRSYLKKNVEMLKIR
jgi:hypothetical protein